MEMLHQFPDSQGKVEDEPLNPTDGWSDPARAQAASQLGQCDFYFLTVKKSQKLKKFKEPGVLNPLDSFHISVWERTD